MSINELYYMLKYAKNPNGNYTLFISHPNGTPNTRYYSKEAERIKEQREQTREFVEWFRKTFPKTVTEYRGLDPYNRYNAKRHFVAYEVLPKDFMLLKLAKEAPMMELPVGYTGRNGGVGHGYVYDSHTKPSDAYHKRQEAIAIRLEIKALDAEILKKRERLKELSTAS